MINKSFIEMCDRVIGELSYQDMMQHKSKLSKAKQRNYKGGYSLSQNTQYLLETKIDYINGKITEEEAKAIFLRQNVCGNVL
jgi:plasmid maintenance system killer protein